MYFLLRMQLENEEPSHSCHQIKQKHPYFQIFQYLLRLCCLVFSCVMQLQDLKKKKRLVLLAEILIYAAIALSFAWIMVH